MGTEKGGSKGGRGDGNFNKVRKPRLQKGKANRDPRRADGSRKEERWPG